MRSWIEYSADTPFPIQNLPYGVFTSAHNPSEAHIGTAIGDYVIDLYQLSHAALIPHKHFTHMTLNTFMAQTPAVWSETRSLLQRLLRSESGSGGADSADHRLRENSALRQTAVIPLNTVTMHLPANIGDYTDFYSSRYHAYNIGVMFRGADNALQPNWLHLPVGYHGRASSVIVSGTDIHRPSGQLNADDTKPSPVLSPSKSLDIELELGVFVGGVENRLGHSIAMHEARDRLFGVVLMNDWSARDIQRWEYVPLGPFTAKNFATSISPWIVTFEALKPFATDVSQDPLPLPYLRHVDTGNAYDISLTVALQTASMPAASVISQSNSKYLYWSAAQQLVHHSIAGCNMRAGDLLGSGTISGPETHELGSLIEMNWKGTKDVIIKGEHTNDSNNGGERRDGTRKFLLDGDEIIITGKCQRAGLDYIIGFGECKGRILPAVSATNSTTK